MFGVLDYCTLVCCCVGYCLWFCVVLVDCDSVRGAIVLLFVTAAVRLIFVDYVEPEWDVFIVIGLRFGCGV